MSLQLGPEYSPKLLIEDKGRSFLLARRSPSPEETLLNLANDERTQIVQVTSFQMRGRDVYFLPGSFIYSTFSAFGPIHSPFLHKLDCGLFFALKCDKQYKMQTQTVLSVFSFNRSQCALARQGISSQFQKSYLETISHHTWTFLPLKSFLSILCRKALTNLQIYFEHGFDSPSLF